MHLLVRYFLCLIFLISSSLARAEYRAFLLKIAGPAPAEKKTKSDAADSKPATAPVNFRLVKSNLDPNQYGSYYPLAPGETISYTETWMCRGRTSNFMEVCANPKAPPAERSPAQNP